MKKIIFIFIVFILFVFGQVFFIGNQVSLGDKLFEMNKLINEAKLENTELEKEIAVATSLSNISRKAEELDFDQAAVINVEKDNVALKR